jgi:hypothetical protein
MVQSLFALQDPVSFLISVLDQMQVEKCKQSYYALIKHVRARHLASTMRAVSFDDS